MCATIYIFVFGYSEMESKNIIFNLIDGKRCDGLNMISDVMKSKIFLTSKRF